MLGTILVGLLTLAAGPTLKVVGSNETLPGAKPLAYVIAPNAALAIEVTGPGVVIFDARLPSQAADAAEVVVKRSDAQGKEIGEATVAATFRPNKKGAPKEFIAQSRLSLTIPAGVFKLSVSGSKKMSVSPLLLKKAPKDVVAMMEKPTQASESASPAPSTTPVAATPTPSAPTTQAATPAAASVDLDSAMAMPEVGSQADGSVAVDATRARGQAMRAAVYDFELSGVDPTIGAVVTDSMLSEVRKLQGVAAIGMDEIRAMLSHEASKQFMGCEENESCLAEIAGALGVDELVTGKLARVDDGVVFVARRIDQNRAKVVGVVNQRLVAGSGQEFLAAIGPAVEQLFPEYPMREGATRGVAKEVALRLDPPPLPKWSFYTVAGGAAAAGVAGLVFGMLANGAESDYQALAKRSTTDVVDGRTLKAYGDDAERNAGRANISLIGAGALAVGAGIMALFTDWHGYSQAATPAK